MTEDVLAPRMNPRRVVLLLVVGLIGGTLSGAFGVGGGIVMVPLLIWLLGMDQRRAAATSLVAVIPGAVAGGIQYGIAGQVDLVAAAIIGAGGIVGSLIGTRLLRVLPIVWLRWGFIVLLVLIAVRLAFEFPSRGVGLGLTPVVIVALGIVVGIASGLFGVGGGVLFVPALMAVFGAGDLLAKGTSLLAVILISVTGSVQNTRARLVRPLDGLIAGVAGLAASFLGVALAFWLDPRVAVLLFATLMLIIAVQLTWRAIRAQRTLRP